MTSTNNTSGKEKGQWEKKTETEKLKEKYRFNGDRYSFRGTEHFGPDNLVLQRAGLYPFPKGDAQQI